MRFWEFRRLLAMMKSKKPIENLPKNIILMPILITKKKPKKNSKKLVRRMKLYQTPRKENYMMHMVLMVQIWAQMVADIIHMAQASMDLADLETLVI